MTSRTKIYQGDHFVGTIPTQVPRSTSRIFDIRPGDFKVMSRAAEIVLMANHLIGPGDFYCLEGFQKPDGAVPTADETEIPDTFNALVAAMGAQR